VDSEFGSVFQLCGAATAKARLPTVGSLTGGTTRRLALVERSVRRSGKSSTRVNFGWPGDLPIDSSSFF